MPPMSREVTIPVLAIILAPGVEECEVDSDPIPVGVSCRFDAKLLPKPNSQRVVALVHEFRIFRCSLPAPEC